MKKILIIILIIFLLIIAGCSSSVSKSKAIKIAEGKIRTEMKGWTNAGINVDIKTISAKTEKNLWNVEVNAVVTQKIAPKTNAVTTLKYSVKVDAKTGEVQEPVIPFDTKTVAENI